MKELLNGVFEALIDESGGDLLFGAEVPPCLSIQTEALPSVTTEGNGG